MAEIVACYEGEDAEYMRDSLVSRAPEDPDELWIWELSEDDLVRVEIFYSEKRFIDYIGESDNFVGANMSMKKVLLSLIRNIESEQGAEQSSKLSVLRDFASPSLPGETRVVGRERGSGVSDPMFG